MDTFHLLKEGKAYPTQHRKSQFSAGRHQATFPVGSVNTSHGGTYRCYGSSHSSPHMWSHPSDPVDLKVTASHPETKSRACSEDQCHTPRESDPPRGTLVPEPKERSLWKSSRPATEDQEETLYAAMKEKQPEEEMELDSQVVSSPAADFLAEDFCERKRNNHPGMGHGSTEIS
ncbi:leukocyte immunoglobulin-like receptor subfamily B member 3 [Loxodonta africana]|uniref:leukocyte immunoglobulin-like receptor subfamily B member 3 n=1 Tax=Loxodonta africana TaxID=9785 RepID=UPI0030CDE2E2